ncbi:hypothetical protein [Paraburkholderia phytofirmans]|uniref:Secreted protein n=1 Tax=Paraburkholderia phytofirmans TaxID=261302 RepID=A0ABW9BAF2_9BURK|nr:hypothetical protein [Paraburkholderia phytofirmans]
MFTSTTIVVIVSVWITVVVLLWLLVRNGALREREEYGKPLASKQKRRAANERRYGNADNGHADSPELRGPSGTKRTP